MTNRLIVIQIYNGIATTKGNFVSTEKTVKCTGSVNATAGRDVILPCFLKSSQQQMSVMVEWKRSTSVVHCHRNGRACSHDQDKRYNLYLLSWSFVSYKDRTFMSETDVNNGNISLILTNVTQKDKGNYTCRVNISGALVQEDCVQLFLGEYM